VATGARGPLIVGDRVRCRLAGINAPATYGTVQRVDELGRYIAVDTIGSVDTKEWIVERVEG
jgi:hypothetical protein